MIYTKPRNYDNLSRYSKYRRIIPNNSNSLGTYTETFNKTIVDNTDLDHFHTVLKEEENRIDIISQNYYNTPEYGWVILLANNMVDPFIVTVGSILRIPPITSLYRWGGALYKNV